MRDLDDLDRVLVRLVHPPSCAAEKEQGEQVSHCASIAATFIGWYVVSMTPRWLPTPSARTDAGRSTASESFSECRKTSGVLPFLICQAQTAIMTRLPVTSDARTTCVYPHTNTGLVNSALMR